MSKEMVISANPHETRVAILEEGQLCEYYVEREKEFALVGSIYKGRVTRVLPGMQSAFVDIGLDSDAFLYVTDFLEDVEELDHVVTTVEEKEKKMEDQGGQIFSASASGASAAEPSDVESAPLAPFASHDSPASEFAPSSEGEFHQQPPPPPVSAPPASSRPPYVDRGQSHSRPRDGGRDFRGRGGRRGGGRSGGGHRSGGGGRSGGGRFSRELPPSKYASHRPYDAGPAAGQVDPNAPEGHLDIILPGESLAKFREKPSAPPVAPGEENLAPQASPVDRMSVQDHAEAQRHHHESVQEQESAPVHEPAQETTHEKSAPIAHATPPPARDSHSSSQSGFRPSFSSGLEPLPGETLSKYSRREAPAVEHHEPVAPPAAHETHAAPASSAHGAHEEHAAHETFGAHESHESHEDHHAHEPESASDIHNTHEAHAEEESHEDHSHPELTEDEAAIIAEHVAEAQKDDAARTAQDRSFASDEESHAADLSPAEQSAAETEDEEERETEEEESDAETEGMLAPPQDAEHHGGDHSGEDDHAEEHTHVDDLAAASESTPHDGGMSLAGDQPPAMGQPPSQARVSNDFRPRMQHPSRRGGRDRDRGDRGRRDDRGRRPQHGRGPQGHGGHHRTAPRRPMLIADLLKQGQEIIVQIAKEPLGKKGARITSHVALPGRSLVYMPTLDHTGVSRKIASAEERSRLRHLVNDAKGASGGGFIVRTAAGTAAPEEVRADVEFPTHTWAEIKARSEQRKAPSLLHRDLNLVERILRDYMSSDYTAVWVDSEEEYTKVVEFMGRFQPQLVNRVKLYTKDTPVFEEFGIQQEIDKSLRPKVWLKSGGYIVINHTEALVAIDVNTGKFVGKGSNRLED